MLKNKIICLKCGSHHINTEVAYDDITLLCECDDCKNTDQALFEENFPTDEEHWISEGKRENDGEERMENSIHQYEVDHSNA